MAVGSQDGIWIVKMTNDGNDETAEIDQDQLPLQVKLLLLLIGLFF